jgi:aspartyl/glutamyl-tRNA(Asn/Gln) amidotransferase C subunit
MNPRDIANLATLARMELSEAEKASLAADMKNILAFIDQIKEAEVDTSAGNRVGVVYNVFREDMNPHESGIYTEALLSAAPDREGDFVKVKKIL